MPILAERLIQFLGATGNDLLELARSAWGR